MLFLLKMLPEVTQAMTLNSKWIFYLFIPFFLIYFFVVEILIIISFILIVLAIMFYHIFCQCNYRVNW